MKNIMLCPSCNNALQLFIYIDAEGILRKIYASCPECMRRYNFSTITETHEIEERK